MGDRGVRCFLWIRFRPLTASAKAVGAKRLPGQHRPAELAAAQFRASGRTSDDLTGFTERMDPRVAWSCRSCPAASPARSPAGPSRPTCVVVGSGVAGLTAALHLREAGRHVTVVTKDNIDDGSTRWAQGGIAAVLDPLDTPEAHASRHRGRRRRAAATRRAVRVLVDRGPGPGTRADRDWAPTSTATTTARSMLTREGGHHANRIVHAGGDATGAEISAAPCTRRCARDPWIALVEHALGPRPPHATPPAGPAGVTLHVLGEGTDDGVGAVTGPRGRAGHRRDGPGLRVDHQPGRSPPATASRWPSGPAPTVDRPGVRAVPPDRRCFTCLGTARAPAAPGLRGAARRGRPPGRRRRQALHGRPARAGRARPPRRGRQGHPPAACWPTAPTTCTSTPGTWAASSWHRFPTILAVLPGRRRRPGHRA